MNHPFGNGLYMFIPPIYGDLGDGVYDCVAHITQMKTSTLKRFKENFLNQAMEWGALFILGTPLSCELCHHLAEKPSVPTGLTLRIAAIGAGTFHGGNFISDPIRGHESLALLIWSCPAGINYRVLG